jgi:hypothetical protein
MVVDVYERWGKYTCTCIISLHHEHMHRAKSVRNLYDYSGVLLWIMSLTYGHDRTGTTLYVAWGVRYSFIPCWVWKQWTCICIAFALFEVYLHWSFMLTWSEDEKYCFYYEEYYFVHIWRWFIYCNHAFTSLWKVYWASSIMLFTSLWQYHWISKLTINYYFHLLSILSIKSMSN